MKQSLKIIILTVFDFFLIVLAIVTAYLFRFDFNISNIRPQILQTIPHVAVMLSVVTVASLHYFKIYRRLWRHAGFQDVMALLKATGAASVVFLTLDQFVISYYFIDILVPRSIYPLSGLLICVYLLSSRLAYRLIKDNYIRLQPHHKRVLVVGAGSAGSMVVKELRNGQSEYYPVAFIDDDLSKNKFEVMGIPIAGSRDQIPAVVKQHNVSDIIIAMPSASRVQIAEVLSICKQTNCRVRILPKVNDLIQGKIALKQIREVSVEDLLGRDPVSTNLEEISGYLKDKTVLVTGAGGSIGSELCRQIAKFAPSRLILLGHGENSIYDIEMELKKKCPELATSAVIADIQDRKRIFEVFKTNKPNVVYHAAAHKHVPLMESNPLEAIKNNVFGTKNVADASDTYGVERFVLISTDKAVNPTNVMGTTKRIAEMYVQSLDKISKTRFSAVRFGNVLGSRGSVIPVFKKQIEEGGPITVTHPDMIRYFMTIPEAVELVIQTGALAEGGEIFILDMGKPVRIADLARDLIRLSGLEPDKDIEVIYTGIRPGEKLFEEILTNEEGAVATKHERIFVGKPLEYSRDALLEKLSGLEQFAMNDASQDRVLELKKKLKEIVHSYNVFNDAGEFSTVKEEVAASLEMVASIDKRRY